MYPYRQEQKIVIERRTGWLAKVMLCLLSGGLVGSVLTMRADRLRIEALERAIPTTHALGVPGQTWIEYVNGKGELSMWLAWNETEVLLGRKRRVVYPLLGTVDFEAIEPPSDPTEA